MKYTETLSLIKQKVDLVQQDIINNPLKYLKKNTIDEDAICRSILRDIEKSLTTPWLEQNEIEEIIKNKKIKLACHKNKKNISYTLTDKRGKQITISNKVRMVYSVDQSSISMTLILAIDGDVLDFNYLFANTNSFVHAQIDITNIAVYLALVNNMTPSMSTYYNLIENTR